MTHSFPTRRSSDLLLHYEGQWFKPRGTTPTTHLIKTQIGQLPNGIDLSNSVENEFYCLKLFAAFGLPVNDARIHTFGETTALVIERFHRRWRQDGRLLRAPQEDCCQRSEEHTSELKSLMRISYAVLRLKQN